jgi:hypothetical protein
MEKYLNIILFLNVTQYIIKKNYFYYITINIGGHIFIEL